MRSLVLILALWGSPCFAGEYQTYVDSPYTYCDAEAVAAAFQISEAEAKSYIGQKIGNGLTDFLNETIVASRRAHPNQFCSESAVSGSGKPAAKGWSESGYDGCHAKMLAAHWRTTPSEAKVRGAKMLSTDASGFERALGAAREVAKRKPICSFQDTAYSYQDAQTLASSWGSSVAETKAMMVDKYAWGAESNIPEYLKALRGTVPGAAAIDGCHAKMLAAVWAMSVPEAKSTAASKLAAGDRGSFDAALKRGRTKLQSGQVQCRWADTPFTYSDAERVAAAWKTSVEEAKHLIVDKYKWGSEANVASIR